MDLQTEKLELFRLLLDTDDKKLLEKIKNMLTQEKKDETQYLLSNEANKKHLEEGMRQASAGKADAIATEDLWK